MLSLIDVLNDSWRFIPEALIRDTILEEEITARRSSREWSFHLRSGALLIVSCQGDCGCLGDHVRQVQYLTCSGFRVSDPEQGLLML